MRTFVQHIRVRYAETDRMGYCYYGNYSTYLEVARVEALRELGVTYKDLEDKGIMLPVLDFQIRYFKPAFYDEELRIETVIEQVKSARIFFRYKTFNASGDQLNEASTTLVFVDVATKKPMSPPQDLRALLATVANTVD